MNELNGAQANNPHVTKTLAAIVENAETHQIELHQPTSVLNEPGAYTLKGVINEYVPGQNLFQFTEALEKNLTSDEIYDYASQMAEGLVAFQAINGFHGDVKQENYMRHENGIVKLTDFGESKILEKGQVISPNQSLQISGTPGYMAPEVCWGLDHDHTADAWSLGATLVDFVCGASPIDLFVPDSKALSFEAKTGKLTASQVRDQFDEFAAPLLDGKELADLKESEQKELIKDWLRKVRIRNDKLDDLFGVIVGPLTLSQTMILTKEFSQLHLDEREELIREWVIDEGFNDEELDEFIRVTNELLCYNPADRIGIDEAFSRLRAKNNKNQDVTKAQLLHKSTEMTEEFETGELEEISAIPQIEIELEVTPVSTVGQAEVVTTVTPDTRLAETRKFESPKSSTAQRPDLKVSNAQDSDKAEGNLQLPVNKYAPGQDLFTLGDNLEENLSSDEIYDIATQTTGSIAEFNAHKGIYGNVHPQNFMSNQKGAFELKPSGAGTVVSSSGWRGGMGTQGFQAPEVCLGHDYNQKADAWSHGATMLTFLLGGESPDYLFAPHSKQLTPARKKEIEEGDTLTLTENVKLTEEFSKITVSERKELIRTWVKEAELDAEELDVLIDVISELLCFNPDERMDTSKAVIAQKVLVKPSSMSP
ncbi:protein kinase domain-containing protein [Endozoicomonas atrinae]|uniref:protein kinase domain-containing protein n=1 Tax=Endozoicomonas atrinae TaxID=1333660 RepID=UPI003AFF67A3